MSKFGNENISMPPWNAGFTSVNLSQITEIKNVILNANVEIKQATEEAAAAQDEMTAAFDRAKNSAGLLGSVLGVDIPESLQSVMAGSKLLGPALEMAFPVTAGIAFGQMLVDLTEKTMSFYYHIRSIADYMQTDWLGGLELYLEGYDKKIEDAEKRRADFQEEEKKYRDKKPEEEMEILGLEQGPVAVAKKKKKDAEDLEKKLSDSLRDSKKELLSWKKRSQATETIPVSDPTTGMMTTAQWSTKDALDAQVEIQPSSARVVDIQSQLKEAQRQVTITSLQLREIEKQEAEKTKAAQLEAEREKQQQLIKIQDSGLLQYQVIHGKGILQEADYWQSVVMTAKKGTDSYRHALDEFNRALLRSTDEMKQIGDERGKVLKENIRLQTETGDIIRGIVSDSDISQNSDANEALMFDSQINKEWADSLRELNEVRGQNSDKLQETAVGIQKQLGLIHDLSAAKREQTLHEDEFEKESDRLDVDQTLIDAEKDPRQKRTDQAKLDVRREKLEGKQGQQGLQDSAAIAQALAAPYLRASQLITGSFNEAVNGWIRGSQTFSQAMQHATQNIAMGFIENIERMGQKWIEKQIMMTAIHEAEKTKQITTEEAANLKSELADSESSMKKLAHAAAVDAGKVYGAFADIPIVGPVLGAAAAAGTYASVMALASFDVGTSYVPRTGIAMIHEGERIFTAADNKALIQMMIGGKNNSDTLNVNHTVNMNGYSDAHFQRALSRNADHVFGAIQKSARRRGIGA